MMDCRSVHSRMDLYLDGELSASELLDFEEHLVDCPKCRAEYEEAGGVVDSVRGAKPLYEAPESSLQHARELSAHHRRRSTKRRMMVVGGVLSGLVLLAVAGIVMKKPTMPPFVTLAASAHLRYAGNRLPLDISSSQPQIISAWLNDHLPFHLNLPNYPVEIGQPKRYTPVGARLLQFADDEVAFLAYEMDDRPISLLLASSPQAAVTGGERYQSGELVFHFFQKDGLRLIAWTDRGVHYALASDLVASGAESCIICHPSVAERPMYEDLRPGSRQ